MMTFHGHGFEYAAICHRDCEGSDHLVATCGYSAVIDVEPMQFHYVPQKTKEGGLI